VERKRRGLSYLIGELKGEELQAGGLGLVHDKGGGGLVPRGLDLLVDDHLADQAVHCVRAQELVLA
jgi:hypothetical protein